MSKGTSSIRSCSMAAVFILPLCCPTLPSHRFYRENGGLSHQTMPGILYKCSTNCEIIRSSSGQSLFQKFRNWLEMAVARRFLRIKCWPGFTGPGQDVMSSNQLFRGLLEKIHDDRD